jgi:hypothetical protein
MLLAPNAGGELLGMAGARHERTLCPVRCRVEPMVTHPAPPQTRTCAIHASGSSSKAAAARNAVQWVSGHMSGEHGVSLVLLARWKPCSTSPSLPWVPWASVPHRRRYYATLRLPSGPLRVLRVVARSLIPCVLLAVCGFPVGLSAWSKRPDSARAFGHPVPHSGIGVKETDGSPKFPSSPYENMPRSQTPVVPCALAITHPGLLPSGQWTPSALPPRYIFRGSITRPAFSLHPAPYGPFQGGTRVRY